MKGGCGHLVRFNMNKSEIFQYLKILHNSDIPTMIYRETVFDIISFGKTSKIHLATTASIERVKRVLAKYNPEDYVDEKDTVKFVIDNDTFFIHSIFKMSYDEFIQKMVPTNLTFNSLLMKPNGQIYDMYGGLEDLKNKKLNFVHTFKSDIDTHLALNCIRYIYKNNFTASDAVVEYLRKSVSAFSKGEKTNALFYLIEALSNKASDESLSILFDSEFFSPAIKTKPIDYNAIIEEIGLAQFIYVILLLLNINVNKSKFSTIINVEEFNEIKNEYNLDLSDEVNYYNLKDSKGYEYLSNIINLQKTICKLTDKEFVDPIYHKQTVFDILETSNSSVAINDECFLLTDDTEAMGKVQMDKKDPFAIFETTDSASVSDIDFSSIFSEEQQSDKVMISLAKDENKKTEAIIEDEKNFAETDKNFQLETNNNDNEDTSAEIGFTESIDTTLETEEETKEAKEVFADENNSSAIAEDVIEIKEETSVTKEQLEYTDDDADDIESLLSSIHNNSSSVLTTKTRSKNPHMENMSVGNINKNGLTKLNNTANEIDCKAADENSDTESDENITHIESSNDVLAEQSDIAQNENPATADTEQQEVVSTLPIENTTEELKNNIDVDTVNEIPEVKEIVPPQQSDEVAAILEEQKTHQKRYTASSLVDSIFEEEVKVKPIEMSSDFGSIVSEVADSTKDTVLDVQRKTVDDRLPEDETVQKIEEIQKMQSEDTDFDINDKDLIAILDELNGKKNNSGFLDDDDSEQPMQNDIIFANDNNESHQFFASKKEDTESKKPQQSDADFFQSLSDDFAEIVGGNT